jgi:putative intracellular protease/amidase
MARMCRGAAGLVNVRLADGSPLVQGRRAAAFTNAEEDAVGLTPVMPFLLESRMRELCARYESVANFLPFAIVDGNLITGQNPGSSDEVARLVLAQEAVNRAARLA